MPKTLLSGPGAHVIWQELWVSEYVSLDNLERNDDIALALRRLPYCVQES